MAMVLRLLCIIVWRLVYKESSLVDRMDPDHKQRIIDAQRMAEGLEK